MGFVRGTAAVLTPVFSPFQGEERGAARQNGDVRNAAAVQPRERPAIVGARPAMRASAQKIAVPGVRGGGGSKTATATATAAAPGVDDAALVAALIRDQAWARVTLVQRFEPLIERLVAGALGFDPDLAEIINDVFVRVFENVHQLKD